MNIYLLILILKNSIKDFYFFYFLLFRKTCVYYTMNCFVFFTKSYLAPIFLIFLIAILFLFILSEHYNKNPNSPAINKFLEYMRTSLEKQNLQKENNKSFKYFYVVMSAAIIIILSIYSFLNLLNLEHNNTWVKSPIIPTLTVATVTSCGVIVRKNKKHWVLISTLYFAASTLFVLMCLTKKIAAFFLYYETFLIISCIILSLTSQNKRYSKIISYFVFWTQTASFFLMLGVLFIINGIKIKTFYSLNLNLVNTKDIKFNLASFIILVSLCVKVPTWPFHFWLTKTHVEASTGFSMYLSGVLVKISTIGFLKFNVFFNSSSGVLAFFLFILSIVDMGIKIVAQEDLKKIVAMATILEMNTMSIMFFFLSSQSIKYILIFFCFHTLISCLFFYIVDVVYKKTASRVISSCQGSMSEDLISMFVIVASLMLFLGIPGTIKFSIEVYVFSCLYNYNIFIFYLVLLSSAVFNFFFFKNFICLVFLKGKKKVLGGTSKTDLSLIITYIVSILTLNAF